METFTLIILALIFGAIIGSFLAVCAYRIPMGRYEPIHDGVREIGRTLSIFSPARSFCPHCEKQLAWWHTIPILSWLLLGGRCGHCKAKIPFRYLFIEAITAILCAITLMKFGPTLTGLCVFAFICVFITITFIDLDYMIIPDVITYPTTFIGLAIGFVNAYLSESHGVLLDKPFVSRPLESLLGLAMGPGLLLAIWWLYLKLRKKEGLGLGDVKLLAVCGATFGFECAWFTTFIGSILGSIIGLAALALKRCGLSSYIPFGPYLAVAAVAYILDVPDLVLALIDPSTPLNWWILNQP